MKGRRYWSYEEDEKRSRKEKEKEMAIKKKNWKREEVTSVSIDNKEKRNGSNNNRIGRGC